MKKMHAISGNKQFMTKRAIPLLKKYGIQKSRANLIGGKTLELRFLIDDDRLERINNELKKMNRTAYDGIMEQLKKVIREEVQKLDEGGMGILSKDQADVLQAIVMRGKNKNSKAILNIVRKDPMFKGVDKREMLGYIEGAKMFAKYMRM